MSRLTAHRLAVLAAAGTALVLATAPAGAAQKACGDKVIADWYDNDRVDGVYQLHCYRDALRRLPADLEGYSNAPDEIERALNAALRTQGSQGEAPESDPSATTRTSDEVGQSAGDDGGSGAAGVGGASNDRGGGGTPSADGSEASSDGSAQPEAAGEPAAAEEQGPVEDAIAALAPEDADAVPLPLLIVAGLAVLLLAAGSASLLARRVQGRRPRPPADRPEL